MIHVGAAAQKHCQRLHLSLLHPAWYASFQTQTYHPMVSRCRLPMCLPSCQAGKREGKRRKGKEREGRSASCVWLAELSQKSCSYISLIRTVSHGHLYFPRSHTHTAPYISLVRTVSHGHLRFPRSHSAHISLHLIGQNCVTWSPAFPRSHTHTAPYISLVRTVSHGHINFPSSLLHTSTHIPLVRTVSHGHHSFRRGFGALVFLLDTFPLFQIQSSFLKN